METTEKIYINTQLNNDRAMTRSILKTAFGNYKNKTVKNKQITPFRVSVNDIKKEKSSVIYSSSDYTKFKRFKTTNQKLIERIKVEDETPPPFNPTITFTADFPGHTINLTGTSGTLVWSNGETEPLETGQYTIKSLELRIDSTNITEIRGNSIVQGNGVISKINVSKFPSLTILRLAKHINISEIDVTQNPLLEELDLDSTKITTLDVTKNTELIDLIIGTTLITTLDISKNTKLMVYQQNTI